MAPVTTFALRCRFVALPAEFGQHGVDAACGHLRQQERAERRDNALAKDPLVLVDGRGLEPCLGPQTEEPEVDQLDKGGVGIDGGAHRRLLR